MMIVNMWRVAGGGRIEAFRNDSSIGTLKADETSQRFEYNNGDSFRFVATGSEGWMFDKYCLDPTCFITEMNPYEGIIADDQPQNIFVHFDVKPVVSPLRELKLFDTAFFDVLALIAFSILFLKSEDKAVKIMAAVVLMFLLISKYKVNSLSVNDFVISSSCVASVQHPTIVNNSIILPVAEETPECPDHSLDAISKANYDLNEFSFVGKFYNNTKAIRFDDEMVVFAASEITNWTSQEFGFRLSLEDNKLYGYVQNGTGEIAGWTAFENVVLDENHDGLEHRYKVRVIEKNGYNEFYWYIDNILKGRIYLEIEPLYTKLKYWIVATTQRWESGWDAKGSKLVVSNFRYK